jgi:3-oxoadipate enol-lactonase
MPPDPEEQGLARLPDGGWVAYTLTGAVDAPAILLHRPLGGSMALWGEFASRLATRLRVIAFDPRGVGRSSDVPLAHTTRKMAHDALALLDGLGVARAHMFGVSLGGMVASWTAILAPERVARLVLASTLPGPGALSPSGVARLLGFVLRCYRGRGVEAEVCLVKRILSRELRETQPKRVAEIEAVVRRAPAKRKNLLTLALAAARHHAGRELGSVTIDTLLLFGASDPLISRASRADLLRDCPHAHLELLAGVGHDVTLEQPREVADRVIAFTLAPSPAPLAAHGQSDGPASH